MYKLLFYSCLWLWQISYISAQTYHHKVINFYGELDTIKELSWPYTLPSFFNSNTCFEEIDQLRLHQNEIHIPIPIKIDSTSSAHYRQNVGIYFTKEISNLSNAVLHEFGFGLDRMIFNPYKEGYYLVLTENDSNLSSALYYIHDGQLTTHKKTNCNIKHQ